MIISAGLLTKVDAMLLEMLENELREGNFVFHSGQVLCLNQKNIDLVYTKGNGFIEGINLNVNWLENFGFFYISSTTDFYTYYLNGVRVELAEDKATVSIHNNQIKKICYVHELQNLFFALTGDELVLKEPGNA